jgi:hypothetical protein
MADLNKLISQISASGGVARPTLFSVKVIPPRVFSNPNVRNANEELFKSEAFRSNKAGEPIQNTGARIDYFNELKLDLSSMYPRLDVMCQKAELPGASFSTSDVRTYGSYFKMPYVDTYSDLTLEFIVGRDMAERRFFDAWRYTIQDPETGDFNYVDEYATTLDVYQLDEFDTATYGVRFFQAWPITVGAMGLCYSNFNQYHTLPVTFTYRKWMNLQLSTRTPMAIESNGSRNDFNSTIKQ